MDLITEGKMFERGRQTREGWVKRAIF